MMTFYQQIRKNFFSHLPRVMNDSQKVSFLNNLMVVNLNIAAALQYSLFPVSRGASHSRLHCSGSTGQLTDADLVTRLRFYAASDTPHVMRCAPTFLVTTFSPGPELKRMCSLLVKYLFIPCCGVTFTSQTEQRSLHIVFHAAF